MVAGSHKNVEWVCQLGHTWLASPKNRSSQSQGCPFCAGNRVWQGFNDLATTSPELAREMVGDPTTVSAGSSKKVTWRCEIGHEWDESPKKRREGGCPFCSGHRVWPGFNDLATTHPAIAKQLIDADPKQINAGSNKKYSWKCKRAHKWVAPVYSRTAGVGCPYCSGKRVLVGFNDMATTHREIAATADGWDTSTCTAGSNKKLAWVCENGHPFKMVVANRALRAQGCPVCIGKKVLTGVNDLATLRPDLVDEADGWDPATVTVFANRVRAWRCKLGHTWSVTVASRSAGNNCPFCAGQKAWPGFNDLATTHPALADEAVGWDPSTVMAGSGTTLLWQCPEGHPDYKMRAYSRLHGSGCPSCAKTGFNPGRPGWLYLFEHELWGLLQIGITNVPDQRLATHKSRGWELLDLRGPLPGDIARGWEQSILATLRRRGVKTGPEHVAGRFDGFSEAWVQEDFRATHLRQLIELVNGDEDD